VCIACGVCAFVSGVFCGVCLCVWYVGVCVLCVWGVRVCARVYMVCVRYLCEVVVSRVCACACVRLWCVSGL